MDWHVHIHNMKPHIFRITTPGSAGTGFMVRRRERVIQVITAAHVVRNAHAWEQVINIHHPDFDKGFVSLPPTDDERLVLHDESDSACLTFVEPNLRVGNTFPEEPVELVPPDMTVKEGVEVGWLGYPYLVPEGALCFFSGHISACLDDPKKYFIDGVAIPGVSGGPAFYFNVGEPGVEPRLRILGSITAYRPNRTDGEVLPGLMVADDASWLSGLQNA